MLSLKGALIAGTGPRSHNPCASLDAAHRHLRKRHSRVAVSFSGPLRRLGAPHATQGRTRFAGGVLEVT
jgi:hypothetical protein